jgi:hypothetical protein
LVDLDRQTFSGIGVDHCQSPEATPVEQCGRDKIQVPALIGAPPVRTACRKEDTMKLVSRFEAANRST